ncbi:MAG: tetratricopeptide repeat protein [Candidatus Riflebacteria bacterium]|nr:tetratricopeptide repeat protein [Candidatus Riflebacteria bacterium]
MKKFLTINLAIIFMSAVFCFQAGYLHASESSTISPSAKEAFDKPNLFTNEELFKMSKEALDNNKIGDSRLYALRLFFDGFRNQNLLNLLGIIEVKAGNNLIASEWFRRANSLKLTNKLGQAYLARLPKKPRPVPVDSSKIADHFSEITSALPKLLERLTSAKLHEDSIIQALERGQIYFALALSEEYEKKYKTPSGPALTALCAWYLGRNKDAINIINQNLPLNPYNPLLLFVKAVINDGHPATSSESYFRALYDLDRWDQVLKLTDRYSKANPNSADAHIAKTRILLDMNKTKEAAESLQEAGKRDPSNPEIELLWVNFLLQRGEPDKAVKRFARAYKRGYNLPAVNLAAGLFAIQGGRINELNVIVNEASSCRPFSDQDAYSNYISILMVLDRMSEAREALDEWRAKFPEKSMYCYLEAFYFLKLGNLKQGLFWLRRGFKHNPNRIDMLKFLAGFPAIEQDQELFKEISMRIQSASNEGNIFAKSEGISNAEQLPPINNASSTQATPSAPGTPTTQDSRFLVTAGQGVDAKDFTMITTELSRVYGIISAEIGDVKKPININVSSAEGIGPLIVADDPKTGGILVTTNFNDQDMIQNIILANFDKFSDTELYPLLDEYPGNLLAAEIAKKVINQIIPESAEAKNKNYWMQSGFADILAANTSSPLVLRYRLLVAQKSIESKVAALTSANSLNAIFSDSYASPAVFETARAQAYLMTAHLIKKLGYQQGSQSMLELIKQTSKGADFSDSLKKLFGITEEEFEKSWKEAAYWALLQGTPYEWE